AARWQQLVGLCREAKERLLGLDAPDSAAIALPGRGRGVIAGAMRLTLDASELLQQVIDGFFPLVPRDARPRGEAGAGLAEFGLPFASDPEISRHLAAFLAASSTAVQGNAAAADGARPGGASGIPDAVLFNGGALKPVRLRERLLDALESWA